MTSDIIVDDSDMSQAKEQLCTDIEAYRKLVQKLLNLRRYKSALYWSEKVAVLSNNNQNDVYQLAQCMFMLKEYNRASYVIKKNGLEKTHLLSLALLVECLYASNDHQEAFNLLSTHDIEELCNTMNEENTASGPDATSNPESISRNVSWIYLKKYNSNSLIFLGYSGIIISS